MARDEGPENYLNECNCEQINGIHNIHCIRFKNEFERNQMNEQTNGPTSILLNKCPECNFESDDPYILVNHHITHHPLKVYEVTNVMPEGQGKRDSRRPRYDLIPLEWKKMLADIFEEGLPKYGDSWMLGGEQFLLDCINHAEHHLGLFFDNDYSERQLEKVAWNCLAVAYHIKKNPELRAFFSTRKQKQNASTPKVPKGS